MAWNPRVPETKVAHPLSDFNQRIAELLDADQQVVGHLHVIADTCWTRTGRLWWKRWTLPIPAVEILEQIGSEIADPFHTEPSRLEEFAALLRSGIWTPYYDDEEHGRRLTLRWLNGTARIDAARAVFGLDLDAQGGR